MKKNKLNSIRLLPQILLTGMICFGLACTDDEVFLDKDSVNAGVYVSVSVSPLGVSTKASPAGGENGDGTEPGQDCENEITDLTLIFYSADGVNDDHVIPVVSSVFIAGNIVSEQPTAPRKVNGLTAGQTYHVLALANTGNILLPATLAEVRDLILTSAWKENSSVFSRFVMTSACDATIQIEAGNNTPATPAIVSVPVERVAARIDFIPKPAEPGLTANQYRVINEKKEEIATVTVDKVKVINRLTAGYYLFKRVAAPEGPAISSHVDYLCDETPVSGIQTNYVVDPWSRQKNLLNLTGSPFLIGGVQYPVAELYNNGDYLHSLTMDDALPIQPAITGKDFYVLNYTLENTMSRESQINGYTTGVVFETTYIPDKLLVVSGGKLNEEEVSAATTFYSYNNKLYKTPEAVTLDTGVEESDFDTSGVIKYTDGRNYYFYWIRHSDNDDAFVQGIMEFAIVRNNIYKLKIECFSGLGSSDTTREPETPDENFNIKMKVSVKKWNIINHNPVYLE